SSDLAFDQVKRKHGADKKARSDDPVPGLRPPHGGAEENETRHRHAVRSAGEARLVGEDDGEQKAETQRGNGEGMSLEAQDRAANDEGDERGQRGADDEGQP